MPIFIAVALANARHRKHAPVDPYANGRGNSSVDGLLTLSLLFGLGALAFSFTPIGLGIMAGLAGASLAGAVYCGVTGKGKTKEDITPKTSEDKISERDSSKKSVAKKEHQKSKTKLQEKSRERKSHELNTVTHETTKMPTTMQAERKPNRFLHAIN